MPSGFNNVPNIPQQALDNVLEGNIGGIISTRPQAKYASGARSILRINGRIVGFAFGISWRINTSFREIETIDNPLAEELVPRRIQVDGSISALHIPGLGAGVQLWQADILSFLFHQYITIEVRDSVTNALLFYTPRAVITTRQEEIRVDQLANVSLQFMAIGFRDEKEPTTPVDVDTLANPPNRNILDNAALDDYQNIDLSSSRREDLSDFVEPLVREDLSDFVEPLVSD